MNAERALIGSLIANIANWHEVQVREDYFTAWEHKLIYRAIHALALQMKPVEALTVAEWLEAAGHLEKVGGMAYVFQLATEASPAYKHYAQSLATKYTEREAVKIGKTLAEKGGSPDAVTDAIRELMMLGQGARDFSHRWADALDAAWEERNLAVQKGLVGISTGLTDLDNYCGGWRDTMLYVLPARPAMGKTALLLNFAVNAHVPAGVISAEQDKAQMGSRSLAIVSGVCGSEFDRGHALAAQQEARLQEATETLRNAPLWINDQPGIDIHELMRQAREWKHAHDIKILFVDYLQKIKAPGNERRERVGEVAAQLKQLARELEIPVVSLAQVNRDVERHEMTAKEEDKFKRLPDMGNISDSSDVEKEADLIACIYRPAVYVERDDWEHEAYLNVCKNRHGQVGMLRAHWDGASYRFRNAA